MSECIRRYYAEDLKEVINEVCEFTETDYDQKFKEWLHGDYKMIHLDEELD